MDIQVTGVGFLKQYLPQPRALPLADWRGKSLTELLAGLGIPDNLTLALWVNGEKQRADYQLQGGETIRIVPVLVGG
jgi:sulfur carrier protein ThiS